MPQPLMIRLDADALAALFPPDSQARVELAAAVIAEFVRKNFKDAAFGGDVREKLERARADAMEEVNRARRMIMEQALADAGLTKDNWGKYKLVGEAETIVKDAARAIVREDVKKSASDAVDAAFAPLKHDIEASVERRIRLITDAEVRAAVKRHIDAVMAGLAVPAPTA